MRIKCQEETLAGKSDFEGWAATFSVKNIGYHSENRIFAEQPFRSAI